MSMEPDPIPRRPAIPPAEKPAPDGEDQTELLRQEQDEYLDEALKETFPASDPIAPGRPHGRVPR